MKNTRWVISVLIALLALAMLSSAAFAFSGDVPRGDEVLACPAGTHYDKATDACVADPAPAAPPVIVPPDPPGVPPPIGFASGNPAAVVENGPAVGYDANGVIPVTQSLSVGGGPFDPPAVVHLPIPEDFNMDSLALARWDPVNNLWVLVPGSGPCGDWICGGIYTDGIFAVVETGWFR